MAMISKNGFPSDVLIYEAVQKEEGHLNANGVLCTYTGKHTGRSPDAKYFVKDSITKDIVNWENNQEIPLAIFEAQEKRFQFFLNNSMVYTQNVRAVRDRSLSTNIHIITEFAKHSVFARNMFIPDHNHDFEAEWTIHHFPSLDNTPQVLISFEKKKILISGTLYSGEIKKSVFTVLNLTFLRDHGLPMHCSVNVDKDKKNPAIFFGLSGTGKTTLSADENRILIGDDEHGWSDKGLTNFEGGCYAKTIDLSKTSEPQIWDACHMPGTILENVVHNKKNDSVVPDFNDPKYTQNSRASYPTRYIHGADKEGYVSEQPKNIIMLTCDAFGVLPAVMKLSSKEAVKQFLLGYTAKVAGTESGITEPKATFSACFGLPFMPCHPSAYGKRLGSLIEKTGADCWLVNTGWSGGSYGVGKRMPINITRHIVNLILDGTLSRCQTEIHKPTGFTIPKHSEIDRKYLYPEECWNQKQEYQEKLQILLNKFTEAEEGLKRNE